MFRPILAIIRCYYRLESCYNTTLSIHVCDLNEERNVRRNSKRLRETESHGISQRNFIMAEKEHHLLEGSQASPALPSDKGSVKVKTLGWLEAVA
jgi:hypothetical protein